MKRVGITMGDPAGIGPEIIVKGLGGLKKLPLTVIGDGQAFSRVRGFRGFPENVSFLDLGNVGKKRSGFGKITVENGRASMEYLDEALNLLEKGRIGSLVTCPVSKEAVSRRFPGFTGHTEYLAQRTGVKNTLMMLLNARMRFGLVTTHLSLKKVPSALTKEKIINAAVSARSALKTAFAISAPRIAVAALNPHASDGGLLGDEEARIIGPAVKALGKRGIKVSLMPADSAVAEAACGRFDCVIAMYHDQALIPLKLSAKGSGVNYTAGLPFVRTSPLHGTAFDIAGKGIADPSSFIAAVNTAVSCSRNLKKA